MTFTIYKEIRVSFLKFTGNTNPPGICLEDLRIHVKEFEQYNTPFMKIMRSFKIYICDKRQ
jgi:hypothetical protein